MAGSDFSTTNYPGKIPLGLDIPSDGVDDKSMMEEKQLADSDPKENEKM